MKNEKVKATFFLVGNNMVKYPSVTKRIFDEGHSIGNHTTDHLHLLKQSFKSVYPNIMFTQNLIDSLYGGSHKIFRPPWGLITKNQRDSLERQGFKIILWDISSKDWSKSHTSDMIFDEVVDRINHETPHKIILLHSADYRLKDGRMNTVIALPKIIKILRYEGYVFMTVDELTN